ncbi:hypothetical protein DFH06DRAFT_1323914 [Mycena polygramma]|nr:hypothetical protein DFH06DRAFT_1323914 [Mycena polygramma]
MPTIPLPCSSPTSTTTPERLRNAPSNQPPLLPLAPRPCDVLSRARRHYFGHVDVQPHGGTAHDRVRAATNSQWRQHRCGQEPEVRPGSVVSPQTMYTGVETRPNGQEVHHAVLLNARMLVHNPATAPPDDQPWELEIPANVHAEVGRQRRPGQYQLSCRLPPLFPPSSGLNEPALFTHSPLPPLRELLKNGVLRDPRIPAISNSPWHAPDQETPNSNATQEPRTDLSDKQSATQPLVGTNRSIKRPDTPYPPSVRRALSQTQSLTGPGPSEDAEIIAAAHALLRLKNSGRAQHLEPASNARLERLQYEARRCARSTEVDIDGLPRFVFNACTETVDVEERTTRAATRPAAPGGLEDGEIREPSPSISDTELVVIRRPRLGDDTDAEGDTDEEYVVPDEAGFGGSQESRDGTAGRHDITRDYFSYRPSASPSCCSPAPHFPTRRGTPLSASCAPSPPDSPASPGSLSPILVDADVAPTLEASALPAELPSTFLLNSPTDPSHPIYVPDRDCPSGNTNLTASALFRHNSQHGSMPALSDVSDSDDGDSSRPIIPLPKPTTYVVVDEKSIQENVRFMTRHYLNPKHAQNQIHLVWVRMNAKTLYRAQVIRNRYSRNNWQMLTPIRRLLAIFGRAPRLLDLEVSGEDEMVDVDLLEDSASTEESTEEQRRRDIAAEETVKTLLGGMALEFADGTLRVRDAARVAVSKDGRRTRELSEEAWLQTPMYRVALALLAKLCPAEIECAALARSLLCEFTHLADDETLVRGWEWHMPDLHQPTQVPPPYLYPQEYAHLRLLLYLFERHEQMEVVDAINSVLNHRFRKAAVVNHFLHNGLLTLNDSVHHPEGPRKIESCATLPTPEPPFDLTTLKERADFFLQNRFRPAGRVTQDWVTVGAN